jgi:tRNA(Ile)-lysidine synthase
VWSASRPVPRTQPANLISDLLIRCEFPPAGTEVTCAVSGGPDSLALLALACEAGLVVTAVHVDHGLREGSAVEADVVAGAAARFGADFRAETVSVSDGPDLENRCRVARREVLGTAALTGHTMDDQAETLLINLMRGAGPEGLAAMKAGGTHPILRLRRSETHALCAESGLVPVIDPTNTDPRFVRNRVRNELLPLLGDISQRDPVPLLARMTDNARDMIAGLAELAEGVDPTDTRALAKLPEIVQRTALREWLRDKAGYRPSAAELARVLDVVNHAASGTELSGGRRVRRSDGVLGLVEDQ